MVRGGNFEHDLHALVLTHKAFLSEGGTNQTDSPAVRQHHRDVVEVIADRQLVGISLGQGRPERHGRGWCKQKVSWGEREKD